MCGIAGIFAYGSGASGVDQQELLSIRESMINRGPDGAGIWISPDRSAGLAHRRLAIIDPTPAGAQPMCTADGRLHITFNGEIYNYRELRKALEARGHRFHSNTDTEVLLYLYAEHGADMVRGLRGMYAFAIHDQPAQVLFLARDPFGIKPLYYSDSGHTVRFASQVKALLKGRGIDTRPSAPGHVGFYVWGHVPDPHTLYNGIKALPAGSTMTLRRGGHVQVTPFFDIAQTFEDAKAEHVELPVAQAREELRSALVETIKYHMVSDVPVGVFLSSGLDSATIAALASEVSGTALQTITLGFEEYRNTDRDETPGAELVAKCYGTKHRTRWISREDFEDEFGSMLEAMDQPSIDGMNTYFVSRAASESGLKVALSGLGGDEVFGGYPSFREIPRMVRALALAKWMPRLGIAARRASAPVIARLSSPKYASLLEYGGSYAGAYLLRRGLFMPWELGALLGHRFVREGWGELNTLPLLERSMHGAGSEHQRVSALELGWYMRNQLLRDSDWAGMAHSLEIRVPLVDASFFRKVATLSNGARPNKRDMAAAPAKPLPEALLHRPKSGFSIPVQSWLPQARAVEAGSRGLRAWAKIVNPPAIRSARVLALVPDAFGGYGGIAQYNRDFLCALTVHPNLSEVVVLPRLASHATAVLPPKLRHVTAGLGGKRRYVAALLRTVLADPAFDMIVCAHVNLLPLAYIAHLITRAPIALTLYGIEVWRPPSSVLAKLAVAKIAAYISISRITEEKFCTWARLRNVEGHILPNAVNLESYGPGPKDSGLSARYGVDGRRVLMTLGRLASGERYKGFDEVLELLPRLAVKVPDIVYMIAGEGDDRERLAAKADALGVRDRVIFTGFVPEEDKASLYRLADVYIHPSRGEGFGYVILEALASGIPTIASKVDGGREALRDGQLGILVDPSDAAEIEQAILVSLGKGRAVLPGVSYFSYAKFEQRLHRIFDECLGVMAPDATGVEGRIMQSTRVA